MTGLAVIREAILNEIKGASFYSLGADNSTDPEVKQALLYLKEQELEHKEWLLSLYKHLSSSPHLEWATLGEIEEKVKAESENKGQEPTLFNGAEKTFKLVESDIAVFAAGILMEKESIEFYKNSAEVAENKNVKQLFNLLSEWEKDHLDHLNKIHETLKERWLKEYQFYYSPKL